LHWRLVPDGVHLVEFFVHTEDVRRTSGDGPRPTDGEREDALWNWLRRGAGRLFARRAPCGLDVQRPDGARQQLRAGEPTVTVVGHPTEIVLFLYGRKDAAAVDFEGPDDAIGRLRATNLGL